MLILIFTMASRLVSGCGGSVALYSEEFTRVRDTVSADRTLAIEGKWEHLEPLHNEITEQIRERHAREKAAVKRAKEKLERRVFGLSPSAATDPARVVSFRDAQSRARQLEDRDDAEEIYQSALRSGYDIMATAVLERALVRGWSTIKEDWLERNAGTRDALDDLSALAKFSKNSLFNTLHYVPPTLNLPRAGRIPKVPNLHSGGKPQGVRPLPAGFGTGRP
ncbi:hypothetical protein [Mycolicibacterium vaccae]|uniref:hypothetical protein n=1 Tax=Mycolicibacterium vaccae TaxID=1810 RepID=UPI0011818DA0|nr:hypothetical protein [Mycolicibacterium vaccae]